MDKELAAYDGAVIQLTADNTAWSFMMMICDLFKI